MNCSLRDPHAFASTTKHVGYVLHFLIFAFVAYLMILFNIIVDLYWRDRRTPGSIKAIWVISSSSPT
jgi:hypothetical protein